MALCQPSQILCRGFFIVWSLISKRRESQADDKINSDNNAKEIHELEGSNF